AVSSNQYDHSGQRSRLFTSSKRYDAGAATSTAFSSTNLRGRKKLAITSTAADTTNPAIITFFMNYPSEGSGSELRYKNIIVAGDKILVQNVVILSRNSNITPAATPKSYELFQRSQK